MSLLEVIIKASSLIATRPDEETDYPIVLNPEPILLNLKPEYDSPQALNSVKKVTGWEISQTDNDLIELRHKFFKELRRKLKNTNSFGKAKFVETVTSHLESIANKMGVSTAAEKTEGAYVCKLVENLGVLMCSDVKGLILEGCISLELWNVLESLIVNGAVEHASTSSLIQTLIEKRRSDLVVLCLKHLLDLQAYDLMCILKYFLMLPSDGYRSLSSVREVWERQASLAIEKVSAKSVGGKEKSLAVLIMLGHDGFSVSELCLHYFIASANLDEVIFAACVSKLNGEELKVLIQYFGKWLRKYERFPQAGPCPKGSSALGLEVCDWIPSLENVVKYLGVVVDQHFSSVVLHSEFHELRSLEEVVSSLAVEVRLSGDLANLSGRLRIKRQAYLGNFAF
ncbi:uncharacterized protein LOC121763817 [Salvia splendens]|uniref:uncharacterized protein LOC121763817 n=1 Tax=Salvia splendens TaxID=180675 RepID=UPI001C253ACC|nr:uncharacterized protein LOC121763817 [Salvia splendens]